MAGTKGRSGRRKKPTPQKKREGTYRSDRDSADVGFEPAAGPPIPDWLHPQAAAEWRRLAPICIKLGLLTEGDWLAWHLGFSAFSTWLTASETIDHPAKWTFQTESGYQQAVPEVAIAKQAWSAVMTFCREFGLTPSSRSSLRIEIHTEGKADAMEGMLN